MAQSKEFMNIVETEEELSSIIGVPHEAVEKKVITSLDAHCTHFISKSPFLVISSSDNFGFSDISPRGDGPGFVFIRDEKNVVIPERPGNRRVDTLRNILAQPQVGLLFFIPGLGETLRVHGRATLITDQDILEEMAVKGKKPLLGINVEVEECFIHCAKAFKRSGLWNPSTWESIDDLPPAAKMIADHMKLPNIDTELEDQKA
nr:MSMEG_1061 family FMN-dependent PPOX-type flavoprotein [Bacillus sp. FJAT-44742]